MQLTYRGIAYQSESVNAMPNDVEATGKYRGIRNIVGMTESIVPQSVTTLRYRGLSYLRSH